MLNNLHTLAFTHKNFELTQVGKLHIPQDQQAERLTLVKESMGFQELLYLSTCNRVEFSFVCNQNVTPALVQKLCALAFPNMLKKDRVSFAENADHFTDMQAVVHAMSVASSIDSVIIGEREIITQVRKAYEQCSKAGLTGDVLRMINRQVVETAKQVYTQTSIATKPVSVVSLAYHQIKRLQLPLDAQILLIGAGTTNTTMAKFLKKHGYCKFVVFNRTLKNAEKLAQMINGKAFPLEDLKHFSDGFDLIISCTGADHAIITPEIYAQLVQGSTRKKTIIDIAIPHDLDSSILDTHSVNHVSVAYLQQISDTNIKERSKELIHVQKILSESLLSFEKIIRERQVELVMSQVPIEVKKIKNKALNDVFKDDLSGLDEASRQLVEKITEYMEKKYIAGPMKLAKDLLIKNGQ